MRQESGRSWKVDFVIVMVIIAIIIFASRIFFTGDPNEVSSYLWKQIGFIPVNLIIVAFLLDSIISKKEKEAILEKVDMIVGTFFTKIGNDMVYEISIVNENKVQVDNLKSIGEWEDKDYKNKLKELEEHPVEFDCNLQGVERVEFLENISKRLHDNQEFFISLINNSNLLEKDEFSNLLLSILHLDEELTRRGNFENISDIDFNHLKGDISRVYSNLVYEWVYYLRYLNRFYPYMISLAIRTNPFDCDVDVHITE